MSQCDTCGRFDPQRWRLPNDALHSLSNRLYRFWGRLQTLFTTKTRDTSEYAHRYTRGQLRMEKNRNPAERTFETKTELELKMFQRVHEGLHFEAVCADAFYEKDSQFRASVKGMGHVSMADVPQNICVYLNKTEIGVPEPKQQGRKPSKPRVLSATPRHIHY